MIGAYTKAPQLAWQGWRLRLPGGPPGGQYHGFIGPDSLGWRGLPGEPGPAPQPSAWDSVWGGLPLREGQSLSDYVSRSPAEVRPRANASGGANVISAFQTERSAGYGEAPGNYRGVGYVGLPIVAECPGGSGTPGDCGYLPSFTFPWGATSTVRQPLTCPHGFKQALGPAPDFLPYCADCSVNPGQCGISVTPRSTVPIKAPPLSPAPAPTVPTSPTAAATPVIAWLSQSTVIPGVENLWIAGGAALAAWFFLRSGKGHR